MFSTDDYKNLAAFLSRVTFNGIQEAALGVSLFSKLQQAATPQETTESGNKSEDSSK